MKRWAFILLASVIGSQLVLIGGVLTGCFLVYPTISNREPGDERCSGNKMGELMSMTLANAFALYAAEK